jgi:hypothetical protein
MARTKRVHLQAILEFIPKAVRLLLRGFKMPCCFGIKALRVGFLLTAMDPAVDERTLPVFEVTRQGSS